MTGLAAVVLLWYICDGASVSPVAWRSPDCPYGAQIQALSIRRGAEHFAPNFRCESEHRAVIIAMVNIPCSIRNSTAAIARLLWLQARVSYGWCLPLFSRWHLLRPKVARQALAPANTVAGEPRRQNGVAISVLMLSIQVLGVLA